MMNLQVERVCWNWGLSQVSVLPRDPMEENYELETLTKGDLCDDFGLC